MLGRTPTCEQSSVCDAVCLVIRIVRQCSCINTCIFFPLFCFSADDSQDPMNEGNRDALLALTGQLKLNVIVNIGLIDKLPRAAGGFMSLMEAQAVQSKPDNAQQMGELIKILLGKTNADFGTFCKMLRLSNYGVWATALEKKAREKNT